jgi:hypothetical protein
MPESVSCRLSHTTWLPVVAALPLSSTPTAVTRQRDEAAAALARLLPAAAELASAREALAARLDSMQQEVLKQQGRLRHVEEQVGWHAM